MADINSCIVHQGEDKKKWMNAYIIINIIEIGRGAVAQAYACKRGRLCVRYLLEEMKYLIFLSPLPTLLWGKYNVKLKQMNEYMKIY